MEVPLLAWPTGAEQPMNAKIVADWLGVGIRVLEMSDGVEIVGMEVICEKVKELMMGEEKRKARERAHEGKRMAWEVMEKGGSSHRKLNEMIECLTLRRNEAYIEDASMLGLVAGNIVRKEKLLKNNNNVWMFNEKHSRKSNVNKVCFK